MKPDVANKDNMIRQYVAICNEALCNNAHRFPFRQILDAAEKSGFGRVVEARISDDPEKNSYVLSLKERRIQIEPHEECGECACDYLWNIPSAYLDDVIHHPDQYISNPARLDWDWLYNKS